VTSEQVFVGENDARSRLAGLLAQRRQPPILSIDLGRDVNLPQSPNRFSLKQSASINPQQFAE